VQGRHPLAVRDAEVSKLEQQLLHSETSFLKSRSSRVTVITLSAHHNDAQGLRGPLENFS
jgi:hypothetical protein